MFLLCSFLYLTQTYTHIHTHTHTHTQKGTIRIFPIRRLENYEEEENEYTSDTTRGLCYTLGALYCFIGFLSLVGLVCIDIQKKLEKNIFIFTFIQ